MTRKNWGRSLLLVATALLVMGFAISAFAQEKTGLPGGATSLQESYQDWNLTCQTGAPQITCAVSQQQTQQNGQRVMAVELRQNSDATLAGNLVLPFGLMLDAGATLQIDDGQPLGVAYHDFTHEQRDGVCVHHPRETNFKENIIDHFANSIIKKPLTTLGNVKADVLALKDMNYVRQNFCSIILGSAWPS